ncbi:MAG: LysR family transcriptional regulator [Proteobacteria bacterium]|nr:LysR family transcriptional regulator [Pseudomonadota bacterium]
MRDINLRHLFALSVIADAGSLSAAAERVHVSQSALTQALRKIEKSAATPLFERTGFGVAQTEAGRLLINRSKRALALLLKAEREIFPRGSTGAGNDPLSRHLTASQLRAFIAIVETGGYSLAARKLGLAQPTVYRAAKELEARFAIQFFRRSSKGVVPSDAARLLARYAELAFAEIRQGFEEVSELQGNMRSRISVGSLPLARAELLPQAVTLLLASYPDARVNILDGPYTEQLHALRYGQIDWIIGALRDPVPTADIVQRHLFEEPLTIVVRTGHPLLGIQAPGPESLAQLEWVVPREHTPTRDLFTAFFARAGVATPRRIIECSSLVATRGLLQSSDRAALLSPAQIRRDVQAKQLAILGAPLPDTSRAIGVTVRADWVPTLVQAEFSRIVHALGTRDSD